MNLNTALAYWQSRQQPTWAPKAVNRDPSIDTMVNSNGGYRIPSRHYDVSNTLVLVRIRKRRMPLLDALVLGNEVTSKRRMFDCLKWSDRIQGRPRWKRSKAERMAHQMKEAA